MLITHPSIVAAPDSTLTGKPATFAARAVTGPMHATGRRPACSAGRASSNASTALGAATVVTQLDALNARYPGRFEAAALLRAQAASGTRFYP